jgi:glucose/arabinose dehydrogenase
VIPAGGNLSDRARTEVRWFADVLVSAPPPTVPATPPRAVAARVRLQRIGRFDQPVYLTAPPGDRRRLFVVERTGAIRVVRDGRKLRRSFLSLRGRVALGPEQGLLSMAFAPDYARSRRFYVDYTNRRGDTRIVEYRRSRANPDVAARGTARTVLAQRQPQANHNGGLVLFGPDHHLYVGLGDGGSEGDPHGRHGNGQNLGTLLGKILRIDPRPVGSRRYRVPRSNPFAHRRGARPEIWMYGLRNPWRFSFDRRTRDLVIADVGQDRWEEVDFAPRGRGAGWNWGWRVFEGYARRTSERARRARRPVLVYGHGASRCSITGGYVVRDRRLGALYGRYVYGDYCDGQLRSARLRARGADRRRRLGLRVARLTSFGEDARGRVYALSEAGPVSRLVGR